MRPFKLKIEGGKARHFQRWDEAMDAMAKSGADEGAITHPLKPGRLVMRRDSACPGTLVCKVGEKEGDDE